VVKETQPSPWLPERVVLTLQTASREEKAFPLTELEEVE
jgi:hypothetical protein